MNKLISVADVLRCIFSITIVSEDRERYRNIRLTCKRFKTVIDTVSVRPLLLTRIGPRDIELFLHIPQWLKPILVQEHFLAHELDVWQLLQAPKHVLRDYFLIDPRRRLLIMGNALYGKFRLFPDMENKLFRRCIHRGLPEADTPVLYGCRVGYVANNIERKLLEQLRTCLGADEEVKSAYKTAVIELLRKSTRCVRKSAMISRELFGAIGSLLPFTQEELQMKIDIKTHAFLEEPSFDTYDDTGLDYAAVSTLEDGNDGLYYDKERQTFRYQDPVLDRESKNPRYWSEATLETWIERLC